ncbi:MAG: hypothetical protein J5726_03160 [Treponema sp.]|nr:hypothetical protein [Treponema sp.]
MNPNGKAVCSVVVAAAITLGTTVSSYRLKKTAELKHWQKALSDYSTNLESQNIAAVKNTVLEE